MPAARFVHPHAVQFIEAWRPLAAWVPANEPGTLAYEAMVADTDPLKVLVFER
jgi:quinol monooxygenase YgiN